MERLAHARFWVIRINRWSLALILAFALGLLLLPGGSYLPANGAPGSAVVNQGVILYGRDFSGKTEEEARAMLQEMVSDLEAPAVAAREERVPEGISYVVPEVNGYSLDVDRTWFRLAMAPEGTRVDPATRVHTPTRRLSDFPQAVIRQGNPGKRAVSLLINVDWGTDELWKMLPILKERGVKATFFVSGRWADGNKHLLQKMTEDGHEIASHGYNLRYGPRQLARTGKLRDDIAQSVSAIEKITSTKVKYWAPHMSEVDPDILKAAQELGLRTVLYSLDTVDWDPKITDDLLLSRFEKAMAGDLILLHPKPVTARVLGKALIQLHGKGLRPVTLSDLLSPEPDTPSAAWARPHE